MTTQPPPAALTMAEIAALEKMLRDNPDDAAGYLMNDGERLLAMARRLVELESALDFISANPAAALEWDYVDTGNDIIALARSHGWRPEGGE